MSAAAVKSGPVVLGKRHLDESAMSVLRAAALKALLVGVPLSLVVLVFPSVREAWLHTYVTAVAYFTSIALGALWFVILQHLVKAGWSVVVRRVAEGLSLNLLWMWVLYIPIAIAIHMGTELYPATLEGDHHGPHAVDVGHEPGGPGGPLGEGEAAMGGEGDVLTGTGALPHHPMAPAKQAWLSAWGAHGVPGMIPRLVVYFALWIVLALFFHGQSIKQDDTGDVGLTRRMEWWAPVAMVVFAITASLVGFDLLMSLDPHWYSTIFGVYYFAGSALAFFAALIVALYFLQRRGLIAEVSTEHYHDVGKLMFGFIVFWAYIGFSQFMLQWYANMPEETLWYIKHSGATWDSGWRIVSMWLVFGHFFIPFFLVMSRWPKRRPHLLIWGAIWMLAVHYIDMFWLVMPELSQTNVPIPLDHLGMFLVLGALFVLATGKLLEGKSLIPERDPRLVESLRFENF